MKQTSEEDRRPGLRDNRRGVAGAAMMDPPAVRARNFLTRVARQQRQRFRSPRFWTVAGVHLAVFAAVYWTAFLLRFDFYLPATDAFALRSTLPWVLVAKFLIFLALGHFDGWWAYVTFADLIALIRSSILAMLCFITINYFGGVYAVPRSIPILDCVGTIVLLGALRGSWRVYREQFWPMFNQSNARWALLVGTDHSHGVLAHQIQSHGELPYRIRGFLCTEGRPESSRLGQFPVLGKLEDVREIAAAAKATEVLVIAGALAGSRLRTLMNDCERAGLNLKIIRRLEDRFSGDHRIPIRDIDISDLLRRAPVQLDTKMIGKLLEGRRVMVTGAGGSIGSEICRQVMRFNPSELVLVGRGENRIFKIERKLLAARAATTLYARVANVTDEPRMRQLFQDHQPEVVFHAAAHKHVPLMETNVGEAIQNNVCGTKRLADLSAEFGVRNFVFISTDKAVHPSSVMGATKHLAERYIHALSQVSATRFTSVRFGNVLGIRRLGGAHLPGADSPRRADHRHRSAHDPLLHDHPGGLATGAASRGDGQRRRNLRPRNGRSGEDRRPRQGPHPPFRAAGELDRDLLYGRASRRKAVRRTVFRRRGNASHLASQAPRGLPSPLHSGRGPRGDRRAGGGDPRTAGGHTRQTAGNRLRIRAVRSGQAARRRRRRSLHGEDRPSRGAVLIAVPGGYFVASQ